MNFGIIIRVIGLCFTIFALAFLVLKSQYYMSIVFFIGLLIYQIVALVNWLEKTNKELISFLSSIRYDDFTHSHSIAKKGGSFEALSREFDKVLDNFRNIRAEKEADYQYLKNIVNHIGIGILSFDKDENIQIINSAAKRIFKINQLKNISQLDSFSPELIESFRKLHTGSKDLVRIRKKEEIIQLAVYAIELYLKGEEFKVITVQNIHSELEEKEMDAWQNLIRVLTHEIRNSVAPISSLAGTVNDEIKYLQNEAESIEKDDLEDIFMATTTIQKRSNALIRFVQEFSNLTHVPLPKFAHVQVADMFEHIKVLMHNSFEKAGIEFEIALEPSSLIITADKELIEQVLINLIKNAIQAHNGKPQNPEKKVWLTGQEDAKNRPIITVRDNGPGIDKDALDRIFIPFFTTKKEGSGIGLSLSRQIMRQHRGTIGATSDPKVGFTEFQLKF